ncbi:MAG TPA: cytochrome c family protein [Ferrovibrio sp.]|uniref:c-type cytochrome n=1 Tax=Ferrovibrio sp. TaxID=1917215 RepID=UPI002ED15F38
MSAIRIYATAAVAAAILATSPARAASGDPARGEQIYQRCIACHSLERNRTGPKHCGLFGRRAGSVPGYAYSRAMAKSGIIWDEKSLDRFLANPLTALPGTKMGYAGIRDAQERADLIAWLRSATRDPKKCPAGANGGDQPHR